MEFNSWVAKMPKYFAADGDIVMSILAEYHRPGFHPNDRDTIQLIADWREALFGPDGELTEVRAG